MLLRIKKLVPGAVMPKKAHESDAGYDLTAVSRKVDEDGTIVYGTGLAMEIEVGYVGLVFPRSSIANKDIVLSNCVGVIDSGYRGEVMAKFKPSLSFAEFPGLPESVHVHMRYEDSYKIGDRIAQLVIMKLPDVQMMEVEELGKSERGTGGYGSSGA